MDLFEAIYTRRSIRKFLDTPVEFDKITEVLKAGNYAPCAGNLQNYRFMLEVNQEKIQSMYQFSLEQDAFLTANTAIIIIAETEVGEKYYGMRGKRLYAVQNCAAVAQNMLLAAHALGLGAVWIGAFDENKINQMYSIPGNARAQAIILLGYPDEVPQPRHLKDVWFVTNFDKYGNKYQHGHRITHDISVEWELQRDRLKRAGDRAGKKLSEKFDFTADPEKAKGKMQETGAKAKQMSEDFFKKSKGQAKSFLDSLKKDPPRRRAAKRPRK